MFRKKFKVIALLFIFVPIFSIAQNYPSRPIKLIVPYSPGGAIDTTARAVAQKMSSLLSQSFVVENHPGGNAIIGTELTIKSPPDGYTFLVTSSSPIVANPHLYSKLTCDSLKDLAPVSLICLLPQAFVINKDLGFNSIKEFVSFATANPTKLSYGSMGSGSIGHLNTENFKQIADIQMTHVPYKGSMPAVTDLAGG